MAKEQQIIETRLSALLKESDVYLLKLSISPANHIKVTLDAETGLSIDICARINRALNKFIEEEQVFGTQDYSMEVSSPGVDEPLVDRRQFNKNIGRELEIHFNDAQRPHLTAKLISIEGEALHLETQATKKTPTINHVIPFEEIKTAIVQISFK